MFHLSLPTLFHTIFPRDRHTRLSMVLSFRVASPLSLSLSSSEIGDAGPLFKRGQGALKRGYKAGYVEESRGGETEEERDPTRAGRREPPGSRVRRSEVARSLRGSSERYTGCSRRCTGVACAFHAIPFLLYFLFLFSSSKLSSNE